jgi:hypothetical protein
MTRGDGGLGSWTVVIGLSAFMVMSGLVARGGERKTEGWKGVRMWKGETGDFYAYDGVFYSFANESGQGIKLWTPPGGRTVRGVILHGNPGGGFGGDTRSKTRRRDIQEFAVRHDFAAAGVTGFPGTETYEKLAKHVVEALRQWGERGEHPELAHVPWIVTGGSNAGIFSFAMMCYAPERTICVTPNVGGVYRAEVTEAALRVPAWMHIGTLDELLSSGVENTEALFARWGGKDPLWTWEAEMKGHENGSADHVDMAYWDTLIGLRVPEDAKRGEGVALKSLDPASGWWVDQESWDHRITAVHAARGFERPEGPPGRWGWMPTEGLAGLYQATATRSRPLTLSIEGVSDGAGEGTSGVFLSSGESPVVDAGDTVRLKVTLKGLLRGVKEVSIRDQSGATLGVVKLETGGTFDLKVDGARRVYALYGYCEDGRGAPRVSAPLQVLVRDEALSAEVEKQMASASLAAVFRDRAESNRDWSRVKGEVPAAGQELPEGVLGAVRLTDAESKGLREPGARAGLGARPVRIDARHSADKDEKARVTVRAAYDAAGLYLLWEVEDTSFEGAEAWAGPGALDFHVASVSRAALKAAPAGPGMYAYAIQYSMLRGALQVQIPAAGPLTEPARLGVNYWDPWDPVRWEAGAEDGYGGTGVRIERAVAGEGKRVVEVFLPWALVGNPGFAEAPPAGSRLAAVLGYNPREAKRGGNLRWPWGADPWAVSAVRRPEVKVYGEIVLLEPR